MRKLLVAMFVLIPLQSSADSRDSIVQACTALVSDYAFYRDRAEADLLASLFTEDAVLTIAGKKTQGREAIRQRAAAAVNGPVFRHMMSTYNIQVDASGNQASGISYVTVYRGKDNSVPQPVRAPTAVGEYHDQFVKTAEGWKIARRTFEPIFFDPPEH